MAEQDEHKAVEARLWEEVVEKFDDEQRHGKYLRFCVEKGLIGQAIKRYDEYSKDKERYPIELRRLAHMRHQQLMSLMMVQTRVGTPSSKGRFRSISTIDILSLLLILFLFFGALLAQSWLFGLLSLLAFGGYMAYKIGQVMKKLERFRGGGS